MLAVSTRAIVLLVSYKYWDLSEQMATLSMATMFMHTGRLSAYWNSNSPEKLWQAYEPHACRETWSIMNIAYGLPMSWIFILGNIFGNLIRHSHLGLHTRYIILYILLHAHKKCAMLSIALFL